MLNTVRFAFASLLLTSIAQCFADETDTRPPLCVAYLLPTDVAEPHPDFRARWDRILSHGQEFYADGMEKLGYGPTTYKLERDDEGKLIVHVVRGLQTTEEYDRGSRGVGGRMVEQVQAGLREQNVDYRGRVLVLVAPLLVPDGDAGERLREVGPYMGGGNHAGGTGWVFDAPILDAALLSSNDPGGFHHRPVSLGRFNTVYIGGVVHELGHAFGLPHVMQAGEEAKKGTSLMGAGNYTYGEELRGQGKGSFLTRTSANILAGCRAFVGELDDAGKPASASIESLEAEFADGVMTVTGKFAQPCDVVGISVYNDPEQPGGDYDAWGYYANVSDTGEFSIDVTELRPGGGDEPMKHQLRLLCRHRSGVISRVAFDYTVDGRGEPDTAALER